ncbi:MAG: hypothetical protein KTR15_10555 [Phycisphaeraceae bacterium]|nr:hypothetical protein [Phycisphaeraceae bacterium]
MPGQPPDNTQQFFGVPERLANLVVRYYDDNLSDDESAELREGLQQNAAARDLFVQWGLQIQTLAESLAPQYSESDSIPLERLAEMESEAQAEIITLDAVEPDPADGSAALSVRDIAKAGRYVFEHALANKHLLYTAGSGLAAAMILIAAILWLPFGSTEQPAFTDLDRLEPTPTPAHLPVVATLTDAVGAQWRSDDRPVPMPVGAQLVAYERFTLTHGFAEITTRRGATALLQAPCTIELTDHDNAIRLHSGKLVGKCETPASKGFTVHAPDMDVVDLGTEFGVEADSAEGSTVLVMTGEVRAQPTEQSPLAFTPVVLTKDQARRVAPETGGLGVIAASEAPVFYEDAPHPYVAAVLDAAPVVYWRFEDDADKTIANEIDPDRDALAMVGPATLTNAGVLGKAGILANREQPYGYFETNNPIDRLSGFEQGTIEFWYYADHLFKQEDNRTSALLLSLHDAGQVLEQPKANAEEMLALELTDDSWLFDKERVKPIGWLEHALRVYPKHFGNGDQQGRGLYTDHAHPVQRWQHVVLVKQADTITLYIDGQRVKEVPHVFAPISPVSVRLGHTFAFDVLDRAAAPNLVAPSRPLLGRLDEVALYDKPLTAEQVARHHSLVTGGGPSP